MKTLSLIVRDMTCADCSAAVKQQLEQVLGVYHVNVNRAAGSATIYFGQTNIALDEIQQLSNYFGYLDRSQLVPHHQCDHSKSSHADISTDADVIAPSQTQQVDSAAEEDLKSLNVTRQASKLLKQLFSGLDSNIRLRLWNGATIKLGSSINSSVDQSFTLVCRSAHAVRSMVLGRDPLRFAEAYFRNEIDIEGDFFAALQLKDHLHAIRMSMRDKLETLFTAFLLPSSDEQHVSAKSLNGNSVKAHSKTENLEAIAFHYDISNDFYALWLDQAMIYSCAYFEQADNTLNHAQQAKLDYVCCKLLLKPGERLLDIGCGWGALIIHAARYYGVVAHGITLSERQYELAKQRIAEAGLQDKVTVELRDYRDLKGEALYDKVSSIGMFEHIGLKNLPIYFSTVNRLLKPAGLFLNHGITHFAEGWNKTLSTEFINRYVFPDGQLDTVSNIQVQMERAKFEIADVESLRPHYALTLRHWVARLEQHHEEALQYVSEATYRIWRLYMAACALEFESGEIGVYQVLASKVANGVTQLPLTRQHMYPPATASEADLQPLEHYLAETV